MQEENKKQPEERQLNQNLLSDGQDNRKGKDNRKMTDSRNRKDSKKKKKSKNREILFVTYTFVCIFLAMMSYICFYVYTHEEVMINNSYNAGQQMLVLQNRRGSIYSKDGDVLAKTVVQDDGSEVREYPYGEVFSHVVGYSTKGKTGVEALANYYLIQSNAPLNEKMNNNIANQKNPGDSVYTTLETSMQEAAYNALGVYDGAIIATNPKTGEVLAMVSKPGFDPNEIASVWEDLIEDDESSVLLNRATQGLYPPGSTFKIVTALEYLKENPDTYQNYHFTCNGSITIDGSKIKCYHGVNHGYVDLKKSFAKSCNSSFANISTKIDWNAFDKTLDQLLFGQKLPFDMESSVSMINADPDSSAENKIQTSIGQGETLVTPLHMNMITCAIANEGVLKCPYVMDRVENNNGAIMKKFSSNSSKRLMDSDTSQILTELMTEVVENGTATKLSGQLYTAAGKTGSAEYNSESDSHAWFTGFAPAEDPQVCVTVIIEGAGSGGDHAVPIARRVFDAYFSNHRE